jgi:hypothetical protein
MGSWNFAHDDYLKMIYGASELWKARIFHISKNFD